MYEGGKEGFEARQTTRRDPIRFDTRAQCAFPCRCRAGLFRSRVTNAKYGALTCPGRHSDLRTINNETRIIAAHKPIAKLSSRCRTRLGIAEPCRARSTRG